MHEGIAIERKQIALSSDKVVVLGRAALRRTVCGFQDRSERGQMECGSQATGGDLQPLVIF
jgi:hypothetical protein